MEDFLWIGAILAFLFWRPLLAMLTGGSVGGGLGNFQIQLQEKNVDEFHVYNIEIKGNIGVSSPGYLYSRTTLADITDDTNKFIISIYDKFQYSDSTVFLDFRDLGYCESNAGYKDWQPIGAMPIAMIVPPKKGKRKIEIHTELIQPGATKDKEYIIHQNTFTIEHDFKLKGYEEQAEDVEVASGIIVEIAMAVAMSDGSLDDKEGEVIKNWIKKNIKIYSQEKQTKLKKLYNASMKSSYNLAKKGGLILSNLTKQLNKIDDKRLKYDAIELCHEVMTADGIADASELKIINKIAKSLNIDPKELQNITDKSLLDVKQISSNTSLETIMGIDKNWSNEKTKKHLLIEFSKWNNRINVLKTESERNNAQKMLDNIAVLRKKYSN